MADNTVLFRLQLRKKTSAEWEAIKNTDIPLEGEFCIVTDLNKGKVGDGVSTFYQLPWFTYNPAEIDALLAGYVAKNSENIMSGSIKFAQSANGTAVGSIALNDSGDLAIKSLKGAGDSSIVIGETSVTINGTTFSGNNQSVAGKVTAAGGFVGYLTGNADTASKLKDAFTLSLSGDASGSASIDGSEAATIEVTIKDNSHNHTMSNITDLADHLNSTYVKKSGDTITGDLTFSSGNNSYTLGVDNDGNLLFAGTTVKFGSNVIFDGNVTITGDITGKSATAGKLDPGAKINGTLFDGSADITTEKWGTARTIGLTGGATGSASIDGSTDVNISITSLDATKLSGLVPLASIPKGALDNVVTVADKTAMHALTTSEVQNGDTVRVLDNGDGKTVMYYVVDDSKLNSDDGYLVYTAGAATSADHADTLTNSRNFSISGGITGTATPFNGSADCDINVTKVSASALYVPDGDTLILSANAS